MSGDSAAWKWELLHPHADDPGDAAPGPRELPGGLVSHDGALYAFGGGTARHGTPEHSGDLTKMGALNDLWRYDPAGGSWTKLEDDDRRAGTSFNDERPCGRMLPAFEAIGDRLYLFGGLTVLGAGWRPHLLNDLWSYDPSDGSWELLEPNDYRSLRSPSHGDDTRPSVGGATGYAAIDDSLYVFGGWAGKIPERDSRTGAWNWFDMSIQLWSYDTASKTWDHHGPNADDSPGWPAKRYCPAMTGWNGKLYLWGGRDTVDRAPEFYNDLWVYDTSSRVWTQLQDADPADLGRPLPRYGLGQARVGRYWYLFGGFGSQVGDGPQLNDLWRCDLETGEWVCIAPHDAAKDYTAAATRPGVRRVMGMAPLDRSIYIFAGMDLGTGTNDDGPLTAYNDFWRGTPLVPLPPEGED